MADHKTAADQLQERQVETWACEDQQKVPLQQDAFEKIVPAKYISKLNTRFQSKLQQNKYEDEKYITWTLENTNELNTYKKSC